MPKTTLKVPCETPVRGVPIATPWKGESTHRHSHCIKKRTTNYNFSNWEKRKRQRDERIRILRIQQELKDEKIAAIELKKERRKENEERRIINERKSEQIQRITNSNKLKKLSKKQWRQIEKR